MTHHRSGGVLAAALVLGLLIAVSATPAVGQAQTPSCFGRQATIVAVPGVPTVGTSGPDVIVGTNGPDDIRGRGGDDRICGRGGADQISGGNGADRIKGGPGPDEISGGRKADTIFGNGGADQIAGGGGADTISGGRGADVIRGNKGADDLNGNRGKDQCSGGPGVDRVRRCGPIASPTTPTWPATVPCGLATFTHPGAHSGETNTALHLRPRGEVTAVMLFVDFSDAPSSETTSSVFDDLVPHARTWFTEVSHGAMSLNVTRHVPWLRMSQPSTTYGWADSSVTFDEQRDYIEEAVLLANAAVDFRAFDMVFVTAAAGSGLGFSPAYHAFAGTGINVDGTEVRFGATFGEDVRSIRPNYGAMTLVHETGHVFGLPDLYDYTETVYPQWLKHFGGWDPMSALHPGGHLSAWHKQKLGWITSDQMRCITQNGQNEIALTPMSVGGGLKAAVIPTGAGTAIVAEYRTDHGLDTNLCDHGVLIYTVDTSVAIGMGAMRVISPNAAANISLVDQCGPLYDAPFDIGAGEISTYDSGAGVRIEVLSVGTSSAEIRVTRS